MRKGKVGEPMSPSRTEAAQHGCPSHAHAYLQRIQRVPDQPLQTGVAFHRVVEAVQRGLLKGEDLDDLVSQAILEMGPTEDLESRVENWVRSGWPDVRQVVGVEVGIQVDKELGLQEWGGEGGWVRAILDRVELIDNGREIVVTDWKGWMGWKLMQPEINALVALARFGTEATERITVQSWSYRGSRPKTHEWDLEDIDQLCELVDQHVQRARAIYNRPVDETHPGSGCSVCPLIFKCPAVHEAAPLPPSTETEAHALADRAAAAKALMEEAQRLLRGYIRANDSGPLGTTASKFGPRNSTSSKVQPVEFYEDLIEAIPADSLAARLAQLAPPGVAQAKKAAKGLKKRDKDAQSALLERWVREEVKTTITWHK